MYFLGNKEEMRRRLWMKALEDMTLEEMDKLWEKAKFQ